MNEKQPSYMEHDTPTERGLSDSETGEGGIGLGKKTGLYGCGLLILGIILVIIVMALTGIFVPFEGTEGVGP